MVFRQIILAKSIILILLLLLSALMQWGIAVPANPLVSLIVVVLLLWGIPGFLITNALLRGENILLVDKLVLSFVVGVQAFVLLAAIFVYMQSTLKALNWAFLLANSILVISYLIYYGYQYKSSDWPAFRPFSFWAKSRSDPETLVLVVAFIATAFFFMYVFAANLHPWLIGGDRWTYLPYLRVYLESGEFQPFRDIGSSVMNGRLNNHVWLGVLAFVTQMADVNLVELYNVYLPVLLGLTSLLSFYVFHRVLFKEQRMALFCSVVYILYLSSTLLLDSNGTATRGGHRLTTGVIEDKGVTLFIFLPVAMVFMFWFLEHNQKKYLFLFALSVAALAVTHPLAYVFLAMFVGLFAVVRVLTQFFIQPAEGTPQNVFYRLWFKWRYGCRAVAARFALLTIVTVPFVIFPAMKAVEVVQTNPAFLDFSKDPYTYEQLAQILLDRHVIMMGIGYFRAAPSLIDQPVFILAILLTPFLLLYARREQSAQFLLATFAGPLIIVFIPLTASLLGKVIGGPQLYRVDWVVSVAQVVGYVLYRGLSTLNQRVQNFQRFQRITPVLGTMLVLLLMAVWLSPHIIQGVEYRIHEYNNWRLKPDYTQALEDLAAFMESEFTAKATVVAPYRVLRHLPALTTRTTNLFLAQGTLEQISVRESVHYLYRNEYLDPANLEFLKEYRAQYILCDSLSGCPLEFQIALQPSMFRPVYSNEFFRLYEVTSLAPSTHLIAGNLHMKKQAWQSAVHEYLVALEEHSGEPVAYIGLGLAYQNLGQWDKALENYRQAFSLAPDNPVVRDAIVKSYLIIGNQEFDLDLLYQALAAYEKEIEFEPRDMEPYLDLAIAYQSLGWLDKAVAIYTKAVMYWPDKAEIHFSLGKAYEMQGNTKAAIAEYQTALELRPTLVGAYIQLGNIYKFQERTEEAITLYQMSAQKNEGDAWPHLELGKLYLEQAR